MNTRIWPLPAIYPHPVPDQAQEAQPLSNQSKFFIIAIALLGLELTTSWYVCSQIIARALIGVIAYVGLVQTMPPDVALYHAQKIAVMDLL